MVIAIKTTFCSEIVNCIVDVLNNELCCVLLSSFNGGGVKICVALVAEGFYKEQNYIGEIVKGHPGT